VLTKKILMGVGMVAVLGLMVAGVAYAVAGTSTEGRAGEGTGGRWQSAVGGGQGGRWSVEGPGANDPQTQAQERLSVTGGVESVDGTRLVLRTESGGLVEVTLGQVGYWDAQGISLVRGDVVVVEGLSGDGSSLETRSVTLLSTGQTVVLRDENGRPMWAGGRRGVGPAVEES